MTDQEYFDKVNAKSFEVCEVLSENNSIDMGVLGAVLLNLVMTLKKNEPALYDEFILTLMRADERAQIVELGKTNNSMVN